MGKAADRLRLALLEGQRGLREQSSALVVVVGGIEGAGRHAVLNALTHHLDTRGVQVHAWTLDGTPGLDRPRFWRYWRVLPARGQVGLFLDGWYATPLAQALRGERADLTCETAFEAQLRADGALVVKLWVSMSLPEARRRLRKRLLQEAREALPSEQAVLAAPDRAEACLSALPAEQSDWVMLPGQTPKAAGKAALQAVRQAIDAHLSVDLAPPALPRARRRRAAPRLATLPAAEAVDKAALDAQLHILQERLTRRAWAMHAARRPSVLMLEGWDAAGKGGVIRRVTDPIDARLFDVHPIAAPSDEERARPWLWRFWRRLPRRGRLAIFDRSWYGRVLVERVEGFATRAEWQRAYGEIADFESQLTEAGVVLTKCWLHIQPETQLARFQERADTPHKRHKLTDEDWRNREKWDDYVAAADEMFARTDTPAAPWTLVPADSKRQARVRVLEALDDAWARALEN